MALFKRFKAPKAPAEPSRKAQQATFHGLPLAKFSPAAPVPLAKTAKPKKTAPKPAPRLPQAKKAKYLQQPICQHSLAHALPSTMTCISQAHSHRGMPMWIFACDHPHCNYREGWVRDAQTGQPRKLWGAFHDGR